MALRDGMGREVGEGFRMGKTCAPMADSCQIDGKTVEIVAGFILGGSRITADGECSHEIKRHLLLGRKAMTNLDSY